MICSADLSQIFFQGGSYYSIFGSTSDYYLLYLNVCVFLQIFGKKMALFLSWQDLLLARSNSQMYLGLLSLLWSQTMNINSIFFLFYLYMFLLSSLILFLTNLNIFSNKINSPSNYYSPINIWTKYLAQCLLVQSSIFLLLLVTTQSVHYRWVRAYYWLWIEAFFFLSLHAL